MTERSLPVRRGGIEQIYAGDAVIAIIVRLDTAMAETTFVTEPEASLQLGLIVYPQGGEVPRHTHRPLDRRLTGTAEVLFVRSGRCEVDLYDDDRRFVAARKLATGDVIVLLSGGHGFRMLEDTVLAEVKQGPYPGVDEKERF